MKIGLVLGSLVLATSAAYAQAPGDYYDDSGETVSPPGMAPTVAPEPAPAPVRQQRWSVGLSLGGLNVAPHSSPESQTDFSVGQIALRYRPWRHLEIELALGGGSEQLENGEKGEREVSTSVLALRYRFNPAKRWNWWLMAGMGSFAVTNEWASDEERDAAVQSTLQFGVGLERRWKHFALQLEIRAVGVAPNEEEMTVYDDAPVGTPNMSTGTLPPKDPYTTTTTTADGWKGGQTTIGASYYF